MINKNRELNELKKLTQKDKTKARREDARNEPVKRNVAIQMINKLFHKVNPKVKGEMDKPPPHYEQPKPLVSEDPSTVKPVQYSQVKGTILKFETRFLNNVCNVE